MLKIFILLILAAFMKVSLLKAESINYNNLNCKGILRINGIAEIAYWNIKFEKLTRAYIELFYSNKKKSAPLRISIQKNGDFYGNGKWKSQMVQGSRMLTVNYKKENNIIKIGFNRMFRAEGKCKIDNKKELLLRIEEFIFIIIEHSKYALNHPNNSENVLRHLKHTCHALDPKIVTERPMPADDDGLINLINKLDDNIHKLKLITSKSIELCKNNLYIENNSIQRLETAKYINSQYNIFYNENFK